jgi:hypothetical protein
MTRSREKFQEFVDDGLCVRPLVLVLETLRALDGPATYLELRTFVLANLHALRGSINATEIANQIASARRNNLQLPNPQEPNKAKNHQHIQEMLNLLCLANLLRRVDGETYHLNVKEHDALSWIFETKSNHGLFRPLSPRESYSDYRDEWSTFYGSVPLVAEKGTLQTSIEALSIDPELVSGVMLGGGQSTQDLGRAGEQIVLSWQLSEVSRERPQDLKHVKDRSAERGIGFDIQSVWCSGVQAGQFRFLEVKTTKRATRPEITATNPDLVTLTSNEYRAAKTHGGNFSVCRVYLFAGGFEVYVIDDPVQKSLAGDVILEPASWNLYLTDKAIVAPTHEG